MLHKDKDIFKQVIINAADFANISNLAIVEKDYYVFLILKQLKKELPNIIFKGGTSLSKAYNIIKRFSEDVDLNLILDREPTNAELKNFSKKIKKAVSNLNFEIINSDEIMSGRKYNKYEVKPPIINKINELKEFILLETSLFVKSYPTKKMPISSFVYDFLKANGFEQIIKENGLEPFKIEVQTKERTFIDKVFALGDYYLSNEILEHSRHLYDLHCLFPSIKFDSNLKKLISEVRQTRSLHSKCLSAQKEQDLQELLKNIIQKATFKEDYNNITKVLIYDDVTYNQTIETLQKILITEFFKI